MTTTWYRLAALAAAGAVALAVGAGGGYLTVGVLFDVEQATGEFSVAGNTATATAGNTATPTPTATAGNTATATSTPTETKTSTPTSTESAALAVGPAREYPPGGGG